MLPKKIYLNWLKENEGPDISIWQREPLNELSDEYNSREYTDLSQVWHPATEEPQGDKWDILLSGRGYMLADEYLVDERFSTQWSEFVKAHDIQRWAYIKDLLPKGGEQ